MTKKIKKLEQETASWKSKWENCDKSLQNVIKQVRDLFLKPFLKIQFNFNLKKNININREKSWKKSVKSLMYELIQWRSFRVLYKPKEIASKTN